MYGAPTSPLGGHPRPFSMPSWSRIRLYLRHFGPKEGPKGGPEMCFPQTALDHLGSHQAKEHACSMGRADGCTALPINEAGNTNSNNNSCFHVAYDTGRTPAPKLRRWGPLVLSLHISSRPRAPQECPAAGAKRAEPGVEQPKTPIVGLFLRGRGGHSPAVPVLCLCIMSRGPGTRKGVAACGYRCFYMQIFDLRFSF